MSVGADRLAALPDRIPLLQVPSWSQISHLAHGFLGRRGGSSRGSYASLNLSYRVGDDPAAVDRNWQQARALNGDRIRFATMTQVHGSRVVEVTAPVALGEADAAITSASGVGLTVLTADCVPLLMVAPAAHAVAAVHAGWRGTLAGIAVEALRSLRATFGVAAAKTLVALGPAVGACCYEVDASIADQLEARWRGMSAAVQRYHHRGQVKARLDLRLANVLMLLAEGVPREHISLIGGCTSCLQADFYSHRSASRAGVATGRQLSFVGYLA